MDERAHLEEVERWRAGRLASLTRPNGWLSLVGLTWLHEGTNTIGGDPNNDVVVPGRTIPARIGEVEVADGRIIGRFLPEAGVTVPGGRPAGEVDLDRGSPGRTVALAIGSVSFHLIRREGMLGIRIRDNDSETRRAFHGIEHFPVDAAWRFEAMFEPYDPGRTESVLTVLGHHETYRVPGAVAWTLDGATHRLDTFLEDDADDLFIVFGDATNGTETYGGGRFLYAPQPDDRGTVILDFNRAYNPPCVFTPYATCALPLPQNRLPFPVRAGEQRYD
jgi:uncharacterized protein